MKTFNPLKLPARTLVVMGLVALTVFGLTAALSSAAPGADSTNAPAKTEAKAPKKLTGAELYSINCNRCHPERYPTEFSSAQWKTIMTHMRVRANLPADQARQILKYLQTDSSN